MGCGLVLGVRPLSKREPLLGLVVGRYDCCALVLLGVRNLVVSMSLGFTLAGMKSVPFCVVVV